MTPTTVPTTAAFSTSFSSRLSTTALKSMVFGATVRPAPRLPNRLDLNRTLVGVFPASSWQPSLDQNSSASFHSWHVSSEIRYEYVSRGLTSQIRSGRHSVYNTNKYQLTQAINIFAVSLAKVVYIFNTRTARHQNENFVKQTKSNAPKLSPQNH